jgi:hypothetical protein
MTTPGFLDWHTHRVGPSLPCRICADPAMCRDEHGRPCHKTCAEQAPAAAPRDALVLDLDAYRTTRPKPHRRSA